MKRKTVFVLVCCLAAFVSTAFAQPGGPLLLRQPALSRTHIVFRFADDLWIVPRDGGDAKRLTTGVGIESSPYFTPDGSQVAFTGNYDGNTDVFVVSAAGGVPKRLNKCWRSCGRILFRCVRGRPFRTITRGGGNHRTLQHQLQYLVGLFLQLDS